MITLSSVTLWGHNYAVKNTPGMSYELFAVVLYKNMLCFEGA